MWGASPPRPQTTSATTRAPRAEPPLGKGNLSFKMGHTDRMRVLEKAAIRVDRPGRYQPTLTEVEETKALLGLAPLMLVAVLFKVGGGGWG